MCANKACDQSHSWPILISNILLESNFLSLSPLWWNRAAFCVQKLLWQGDFLNIREGWELGYLAAVPQSPLMGCSYACWSDLSSQDIANGNPLTCLCLIDFKWLGTVAHSAPEKYDFWTVSFANVTSQSLAVPISRNKINHKTFFYSVNFQFLDCFIISWYIIALQFPYQLHLSQKFWCL